MAGDEPRRSVRATKGQHKAHEGSEEPAPKPKVGKSKGSKKAAEPEPEEDDDDGEDVIRCVCGHNVDDLDDMAFIACDECEVWQHNICMGVPLGEDEQPEHYYCEQCHPEDHKDLIKAIKNGEKPWLERQKAAKAAKNRRKSGGKKAGAKSGGGRQSRVSDIKPEGQAAASSSPAPAPAPTAVPASETSNKRKFQEEPPQIPLAQPESKTSSPQVQESVRVSTTGRGDKRRKSSTVPKAKQSDDVETALVSIEELPKDRQNAAVALTKVVADGVRERSKAGQFRVPDKHNVESLGQYHASRIEYALFMNHSGPDSKYAPQFRQVLANLKNNPLLLDGVLKGSLTADELSTMSSQEMASEKLQKERAQLKEEVEKQSVMVRDEDGPRVRRTHKGDEIVEDDEQQGHIESVFAAQPVRHRESMADSEMPDAVTPQHGEARGGAGSPGRDPYPIDTNNAQIGQDRRASSQQFDINNVWAKTQQSPDAEQASNRMAHRQSSVARPPQSERQKTDDADIDRLLADDDDQAYSPADIGGDDSTIVWRGKLVQSGVADLTTTGRFIAGNDFSQFVSWQSFLPDVLEIEGRLGKDKADDYLCGLQWSKKSDVAVLALTPYDNREAFDAIFDYFISRNRYAVGKKGHNISELVKDLYISPIEPGSKPPPHIDLLDHCSLQFPLSERMLFATFVVNKPASWDAEPEGVPEEMVQSLPMQDINGLPPHLRNTGGPAGSPLAAQAPPAYSPRPSQGFTPSDNSNGIYGGGNTFGPGSPLPPNPYGAPPQVQTPAPLSSQMIQGILGPYANAPVVIQLLAAAGSTMNEITLRNMRDVLEKQPKAREDMAALAAFLQQR